VEQYSCPQQQRCCRVISVIYSVFVIIYALAVCMSVFVSMYVSSYRNFSRAPENNVMKSLTAESLTYCNLYEGTAVFKV